MSNTFRELFDEDERDELLFAMNARLNSFESRLARCRTTEQATNVVTEERLERNIIKCKRIIATLVNESN